MTGFRTAIKNVRLDKKTGKLVRVHKLQAGKSIRTEHAKAKRQADKWAEHYTPIEGTKK